MTATEDTHGKKFSKKAFFVAIIAQAAGTGLLYTAFDFRLLEDQLLHLLSWVCNPAPMAIFSWATSEGPSTSTIYTILFSWSVVVGLWFGFSSSMKREFKPYDY